MKPDKTYRDLTASGDYYSGTPELWEEYWEALERGDYNKVVDLEEGTYSDDFYYDPNGVRSCE